MAVALRTPHLLLREWRDEDVDIFFALLATPEVTAMLPPLPDRDACAAWIGRMRAHNAAHGFAYWAVELPGEAPLIGAIGLTRVNFVDAFGEAVEIGWRLAGPYWGKGYATEAARAVIEDGFYRLDINEIVAFTVPMNRRSRAVMTRLGMTRDPADDFDFHRFEKGTPCGATCSAGCSGRGPRPARARKSGLDAPTLHAIGPTPIRSGPARASFR